MSQPPFRRALYSAGVSLPTTIRIVFLGGVFAAAVYTAWDSGSTSEAPPPTGGQRSAAPGGVVASPTAPTLAGTGRSALVDPHSCYYARIHAEAAPPVASMLAVAEVLDEGLMNRDCGDSSQSLP